MKFFGYTRFLEAEVARLNQRIENLEARNQELVIVISSKSVIAEPLVKTPPQLHKISNDDTEAKCSCGWSFISNDPGELQQAISMHYQSKAVQRGRKSWPQVQAAAEAAALAEAQLNNRET